MEYTVYVLVNSKSKRIYIGQTSDLGKRLARHNGNIPSKLSSFTSKNIDGGVWETKYKEVFKTRKEAIIREKELKSYQGRQFIKNKLLSDFLVINFFIWVVSSVGRAIAS